MSPPPATDSFQTVEVKSINAPGSKAYCRSRNTDKVLFLELGPEDSGKKVEIRYQVQRLEKAAYAAPMPDQGKYLKAERLVPTNEHFCQIAEKVVQGKTGDLVRARCALRSRHRPHALY